MPLKWWTVLVSWAYIIKEYNIGQTEAHQHTTVSPI